jgi:hypothetical protein
MWWLPVLFWTLVFIVVFMLAWLSFAKFRYYDSVERAKIFQQEIPKPPWYVKIQIDWRKYLKR